MAKSFVQGLADGLSAGVNLVKAAGLWMVSHWRIMAAMGIALAVGIAVAALAVYFPPILFAVGATTLFGVTPFAFLSTLSFPGAVAAVSAIAAGFTFLSLGVYNLVVASDKKLDNIMKKISGEEQAKRAADKAIFMDSLEDDKTAPEFINSNSFTTDDGNGLSQVDDADEQQPLLNQESESESAQVDSQAPQSSIRRSGSMSYLNVSNLSNQSIFKAPVPNKPKQDGAGLARDEGSLLNDANTPSSSY